MKKKELNICIVGLIGSIVLLVVVNQFNLTTMAISIISTLCGSIIAFTIGKIYSLATSGISHFTGYYRDEIFSREDESKIIKRDKFELTEKSGNVLFGSFTRYFPQKDALTHWECSGFIVLDQFLFSYRADQDVTPSRGVLLAKLDTKREHGFSPCYSGKYFKFEGEEIIAHKISKEEYENL